MRTVELDAGGVERVLGHGHQDAILVVADDCLQNVAHRRRGTICQEDVLGAETDTMSGDL